MTSVQVWSTEIGILTPPVTVEVSVPVGEVAVVTTVAEPTPEPVAVADPLTATPAARKSSVLGHCIVRKIPTRAVCNTVGDDGWGDLSTTGSVGAVADTVCEVDVTAEASSIGG